MKMTIGYSAIILSIWVLGMVLDVIGLYIGVKFASINKVKPSKVGYYIMRAGEFLEGLTKKAMIYIPSFFILEILKMI